MKQHMRITNSIHGQDTKVLYLPNNKLMNKIDKQIKRSIFVREGWRKEDSKKNKEKSNNNYKNKRNSEKISIMYLSVSNSLI